MGGKGDKVSEFDLGALERDLLEYDINETEDGGTNETLVLMIFTIFIYRELPEEEGERYQGALERKTGETWTRVAFMESTWGKIRRFGTHSVMRVGLNQPILSKITEKTVKSTESESVTEGSPEENPIMRD